MSRAKRISATVFWGLFALAVTSAPALAQDRGAGHSKACGRCRSRCATAQRAPRLGPHFVRS